MNRIMVDKSLCEGCLNCVLACMVKKGNAENIYDLDLEDNKNESMNHISLDKDKNPTPIFCRHCEEPECAITCMSGAMTKNKETGVVEYNEDKCASCFMCIMSCPYGVLKADDDKKKVVLKCDMCGGTPACVNECPTGAIYVQGGEK
ncbi:4Fe-4S dicluster domain-containing protein [Tepidibacter aestuarii]|uniref:4Fe-4S dicluster domain-containing protein n=1 Tax=Tepidibacter aestuarii TaxID=2925782 RepID=UPI0020BDC952|nr:4Fe-4S dicluster domain-containing protein [Tepidibacter aestuarii]CAH2214900.1 NADH-dependent phenylglyoxylate dehydrogenase subunit beta [Tepidibacter aestuarii]